MANQKISQLTAVVTPAGTDEMPVNQGGTTKRLTSEQVRTYAMANSTADELPFSDASTGGLASTNTGDAIRELDDNFDTYTNMPLLPQYATAALPLAASNAGGQALVTDSDRGIRPVYSDGSYWRYFSDDAILTEGVEAIPVYDFTIDAVAPVATVNHIALPSAVSAATSTTVPSVVNTTP